MSEKISLVYECPKCFYLVSEAEVQSIRSPEVCLCPRCQVCMVSEFEVSGLQRFDEDEIDEAKSND